MSSIRPIVTIVRPGTNPVTLPGSLLWTSGSNEAPRRLQQSEHSRQWAARYFDAGKRSFGNASMLQSSMVVGQRFKLQARAKAFFSQRVASSICGLTVGVGTASLLALFIEDQNEKRKAKGRKGLQLRKLFAGLNDKESLSLHRPAPEPRLDDLARRLIRKNSRLAVSEAYSFPEAEPLGAGSFGVVLRAVHRRTGQERAVKRISKTVVKDPGMLSREVEALRLMDHPYVCRLVEYFETTDHHWLVTELCRGEELCLQLMRNPSGLPEQEAARLAKQMLRATLHCHRREVLHRDLKPENFLFAREGGLQHEGAVLKLIDFGFAVPPHTASSSSSAANQSAGTLLYSSPQVLKGEPASWEDDAWSLGVIFHILLTGQFPFSTNDDARFQELSDRGLLEQDVQDHLRRLRLVASTDAVDLVSGLLCFDRRKRLTVEDALRHNFVALRPIDNEEMLKPQELHDRFSRFVQSCMLRRIVLAALAHLVGETTEDAQKAAATFLALDADGDGKVSCMSIRNFFRVKGGLSMPPGMARLLDEDASGVVSYTTFLAATLDVSCLEGKTALCRAVFELLDADHDGTISAQDLQKRLHLSQKQSEETISEASGKLGSSPSQFVSGIGFDGFLQLMHEAAISSGRTPDVRRRVATTPSATSRMTPTEVNPFVVAAQPMVMS